MCFIDWGTDFGLQLVMEFVRGGNLEYQNERYPFDTGEMVSILYQCLDGIAKIHAENIIHRDVKPTKILVDMRFPINVKICDFGLAKFSTKEDLTATVRKTWLYCAPEMHSHLTYRPAVDVWSLGKPISHRSFYARLDLIFIPWYFDHILMYLL